MSLTTTLKGPAAEKAYMGAPGVTGFLTGGYALATTIESGGRNWSHTHHEANRFKHKVDTGLAKGAAAAERMFAQMANVKSAPDCGPG